MPNGDTNRGPLSDLRVIEMGSLIAGPFCGQLMGDFGADVVKVEPPGSGDPMRQWGQSKWQGTSLWWPVIGRNKRSVTLDLRQARGQALARQLIDKADVLIENFRPGTLERWGLDYATLAATNPRLIMVRVSGFGQTGPYAERAGFGAIGEALGGLRYVTGDPTRPPTRTGISIGDSLAATFAFCGALAALHARERSGRGQVVDSAIYESVLSVMESLVTEYDKTGYVRERTGATLPKVAPSNAYPTKDGLTVLIAANQDTVFARLAEAMGEPALADDARFATHTARGEHQAEIDRRVAAWTATLSAQELVALLARHGVPAGGIYRAPDMLADPHFAAREAIVETHHPLLGMLRMQNVAPRLSATPGAIRRAAPSLGEHNAEIYEEIGLTRADLDALAALGVI